MSSLKTNVVFNFINTLTGILFPIITFPYAARILLPEGIGAVNFYQSIINYIALLTSLGIPIYAVKEVAKYRDNVAKRNRITVEITLLSTVLCLFGYLLVWILASFVPQINSNVGLFLVISLVDNPWLMTMVSLVVGSFSYAGILLLLKDSLIREILFYMKLNTLFKR